jgi:ATP-dependent DNA ligase
VLFLHLGTFLPLVRRREVLATVCENLDVPEVEFSHAVIGTGSALFQAVVAAGHEGVVAKLLMSAYRPGKRSVTWKKIKPTTRKIRSQRDIFSR